MSEREPWVDLITTDDILDLHAEGIRRYGGDGSPPKEGCVEGCLGAAWHLQVYRSPEDAWPCLSFCAGLLYYLTMNHCFIDGNKRIGWMSAMEVLRSLGLTVKANEEEAVQFCLDITSSSVKCATDVIPWLAQRLEEFPVV